MGVIKIPTNFNLEIEFEVPEFYRRLLAWLADVFIQFMYLIIAGKVLSLMYSDRSFFFDVPVSYRILQILIWFPVFFYYLVFEIFTNGQSIGKKLAGLRVVNENGGKASLSQFIIRWMIRVSDMMIAITIIILVFFPFFFQYGESRWLMLILLVMMLADLILVASTKKGQRLGDILAHTILVRTKTRGSIHETVFLEVADNYRPQFPQIMQLSDKDINAIKSILDTANRNNDFQLAAMAAEKIKAHLKLETSMSPFDFLSTALKDYNYLSVK